MNKMTAKPSLSYETIDSITSELLKKYKLEDLELCSYSKVYDAIFEAVETGFYKAVKRYLENTSKMFEE